MIYFITGNEREISLFSRRYFAEREISRSFPVKIFLKREMTLQKRERERPLGDQKKIIKPLA